MDRDLAPTTGFKKSKNLHKRLRREYAKVSIKRKEYAPRRILRENAFRREPAFSFLTD